MGTADQLNGIATIIVDKVERGTVTYWLDSAATGIVDGTIVGDETVMVEMQAAGKVELQLHDRSIREISPYGGSDGIRWVRFQGRSSVC